MTSCFASHGRKKKAKLRKKRGREGGGNVADRNLGKKKEREVPVQHLLKEKKKKIGCI